MKLTAMDIAAVLLFEFGSGLTMACYAPPRTNEPAERRRVGALTRDPRTDQDPPDLIKADRIVRTVIRHARTRRLVIQGTCPAKRREACCACSVVPSLGAMAHRQVERRCTSRQRRDLTIAQSGASPQALAPCTCHTSISPLPLTFTRPRGSQAKSSLISS
jgi:hypothetical protein